MHELAITQSIVAAVAEHAAGRRVRRVVLEVGALAGVMPAAVEFCFGLLAGGTTLDGAILEIRRIEARARCRACGTVFAQATLYDPCPCGGRDVERLSGEELDIREYEIEARPRRRHVS